MRSASLPASTVPSRSPTRHSSAALRVAACRGLPGGRAVADPEAHFQQGGLAQGADVGAQSHLGAGIQGAAEPVGVLVGGGVGAALELGGDVALGQPTPLVIVLGLALGEVGDGQGGHVPGGRFGEGGDALLVHDVAVLDGVGAEAEGGLDGVGVGGVGHDGKLALSGDGEGGGELLLEKEGVPVAVPVGAHDAAGEVELDVVDAVLDLLADAWTNP